MSLTPLLERSTTVPVADADLHVKLLSHPEHAEDKARPVLVFLHEALGSVAQWKSFPRELCKATGCDGVVYDRKGHGQSSAVRAPRELDFYREEAAVYLDGLLHALDIQRPILFGHSDGATIALKYASLFPDTPAAVISEAAHVIIEQLTLDGIREARAQYASTDLGEKLARYHGNKTDSVFYAWVDTWLAPGLADWDMVDDLRMISCPVLVVQGEDDQYGSRRQVDTILAYVSGRSQLLWMEGCGHVPHLQARPQVIEHTVALINSLSETS
jgi:pimeloyl-ACP methyl ester carboxylesterase